MDADIHLEQILTQAQRRIRLIDMAIGGMVMVIFTFGFFFSEVLLDHFIILRRPYRLGLLVLYQVASIGLVLWLVLRPVFRRINQLFIAHRIEHQHPELKNRLVTYLQLDNETSPIIRHDISNNISRKLEGFAVPSVFSFKVLKPFAAAFIALSLLIYGYALLSQKSITVSLKRAIFPTQQILPPTLTKISRVEPGDADVLKGNPVEFWAQTEGNSPETADLVYSMDDGTTWETMPMTVSGNGILKASMEAPEDTIRYFLAAGDTRSERYVVTVVNPPTLTSIRGELFFPAYTGLEKREFQGGTVKAIEGSRATIQGETNVPVNQAQVMLGNSKDSTIVRITTPQRITFDVAVHSNDIYRVLLTSTQGYKELNPPRHRIIALKDKPPEVRAIQPAQDVELAENESLELVFRMRDDFGLTSVKLRLKSRFEEERILPLVVPDLTREKTANVRLPVKSLGLRAGDEATYSILVQDNKPDEPNAGESQTFGLRILDSRPVQLALNAPEESDTTVETDQTEQEASEEQGEQSSDEERAERDNSQADSESPANSAASTPDAEDSNEADSSEDAGDGDRDEGASQTDEEDEQQRAGDNEQSDSDSTEGQNSETDTAGDGSTEQNAEQSQSGTNSEDSQDGSTDAEGAQPAAGQEPEANRTQSNDQNSGTQPSDSQQGEASDTATSRASDSSQDSGTDSQPGQQAGAEEGTQPGQQQGEQTGSQPGQQAVSQPGQQQGEQTGSQPGQQQGEQPGSQSGQ
ncbi:MAG: hypothetical protein QGG53_17210, partial [Planctomycetota bacterium]|nr:hypothetical protein [Planctomycetota bacterium]